MSGTTMFGDPIEAPAQGGAVAGQTMFGDPIKQQAAPNRWNAAAEGIVNDMGAAFQGVNPVAVSEQRGQAVGVLRPRYPGSDEMIVDVDGVADPVENYPADRFVTRVENGATYVYPRTPDMAASRAERAGRVLGYGAVEQFTGAAKTAAAAPSKTAAMSQDAADLGITPSFAMRGRVEGQLAAAGEQFLPTSPFFRGDKERVTGEIANAAASLADRAGPGITTVDAGEALQRGGHSFVDSVRKFQGALYDAVDAAIPPDTPINPQNAIAALHSKLDPLKDLPAINSAVGNGKLGAMLADLESGKMTWTAARQLRTDIGEAIGSMDQGPMTDVAKGKLKFLYAALTHDLGNAAASAGDKAAWAWDRATEYTKASEARIETAFGKVLGKNVAPERAYSMVTNMAAEGTSGANIEALRQVFGSLPRDDAATVAGTVIRRLGRAAAGAQDAAGEAFSADTFLTNWNKMSPEARAIIGSAGMDTGVGQELSKLARVAERAKATGVFTNRSNTGNALTTGALGASLMSNPAATIAGSALAGLSALALTNKPFLSALNRFAASGKRDGLVEIAKGSGPLAIEAAKILQLQSGTSSPGSPASLPGPATYSGAP